MTTTTTLSMAKSHYRKQPKRRRRERDGGGRGGERAYATHRGEPKILHQQLGASNTQTETEKFVDIGKYNMSSPVSGIKHLLTLYRSASSTTMSTCSQISMPYPSPKTPAPFSNAPRNPLPDSFGSIHPVSFPPKPSQPIYTPGNKARESVPPAKGKKVKQK